jgi:endonuclease III
MAPAAHQTPDWETIIPLLREELADRPQASVTEIAELGGTPFEVLISTMISLRTRDEVTLRSSRALFEHARTPQEMIDLEAERISQLIYPAGFYRNKAKQIRGVSELLLSDHGGDVPHTVEELVALPGVGRKTANLVLGLGFGIPSICVDTHVHRIPNRAGWIETQNPEQTEDALSKILPRQYWIEINTLLVSHGQGICTPLSPRCSQCSIASHCQQRGVDRTR